MLDSIDDVIDQMKAEWLEQIEQQSPATRAAYEEYLRLEALDMVGDQQREMEVKELAYRPGTDERE